MASMPETPTRLSDAALEALKAKAEKATRGLWRYVPADNVFVSSERGLIVQWQPRSHGVDVTADDRKANGEFIAAANPETLLALLAEVQQGRQQAAADLGRLEKRRSFVVALINAIGEVSKTEALDALEKEWPASREGA